jgi:hypothetical protein
MAEVARTIVKSPPELWAEVSDPEALTRHLGAFGEIRITRLEPEATVAWEGDRVRGTVDLSPAGWGTKVRVTAEELEAAEEPKPEALAEPEPEPEPVPEPPAPEPVAVADPEPEPEAEAIPDAPQRRVRWWSKWFRRPEDAPPTEEPVAVVVDEPPAVVEEPVAVVEEPDQPTSEQPAVEEDTSAVLDGMLDSLGSAHHRPFSRG